MPDDNTNTGARFMSDIDILRFTRERVASTGDPIWVIAHAFMLLQKHVYDYYRANTEEVEV